MAASKLFLNICCNKMEDKATFGSDGVAFNIYAFPHNLCSQSINLPITALSPIVYKVQFTLTLKQQTLSYGITIYTLILLAKVLPQTLIQLLSIFFFFVSMNIIHHHFLIREGG